MSYKANKPGLVSVLAYIHISIHYMVSLFIRAPFYVLLVFIATYVFCLLVVLVKLSVLAK